MDSKGKLYIGTGVSGGEEGALKGPSLMPGGSPAAWPLVAPIFQKICAHVNGEPCCDWVGEGGAGHFVKMVHNGIEYGDMQLICEAYQLMKDYLHMSCEEMHEVFSAWNRYTQFRNYGVVSSLWERRLKMEEKPASCVGCGACEEKCPQHLPIREDLLRAAADLDDPVWK